MSDRMEGGLGSRQTREAAELLGMESREEKIAILYQLFSSEEYVEALFKALRVLENQAFDKLVSNRSHAGYDSEGFFSSNLDLIGFFNSITYRPELGISQQELVVIKNLYFLRKVVEGKNNLYHKLTVEKLIIQLQGASSMATAQLFINLIAFQIQTLEILQSLSYSPNRVEILNQCFQVLVEPSLENIQIECRKSAHLHIADSLQRWEKLMKVSPSSIRTSQKQILDTWKTSVIVRNLRESLNLSKTPSIRTKTPLNDVLELESQRQNIELRTIDSVLGDKGETSSILNSLGYFRPCELQEYLQRDGLSFNQSTLVETALLNQLNIFLPSVLGMSQSFDGSMRDLLLTCQSVFDVTLFDPGGEINQLGSFLIARIEDRRDSFGSKAETPQNLSPKFDQKYAASTVFQEGWQKLSARNLDSIKAKTESLLIAIQTAGGIGRYLKKIAQRQAIKYGWHLGKNRLEGSVIFDIGQSWRMAIEIKTGDIVYLGDHYNDLSK